MGAVRYFKFPAAQLKSSAHTINPLTYSAYWIDSPVLSCWVFLPFFLQVNCMPPCLLVGTLMPFPSFQIPIADLFQAICQRRSFHNILSHINAAQELLGVLQCFLLQNRLLHARCLLPKFFNSVSHLQQESKVTYTRIMR